MLNQQFSSKFVFGQKQRKRSLRFNLFNWRCHFKLKKSGRHLPECRILTFFVIIISSRVEHYSPGCSGVPTMVNNEIPTLRLCSAILHRLRPLSVDDDGWVSLHIQMIASMTHCDCGLTFKMFSSHCSIYLNWLRVWFVFYVAWVRTRCEVTTYQDFRKLRFRLFRVGVIEEKEFCIQKNAKERDGEHLESETKFCRS
jgi:hypothetical protein